MTIALLAPQFLAILALAAVVVALHVQGRRRIPVPSTLIWRDLPVTPAPSRRASRRPRITLPLLLQLGVIVCCALALARPTVGTGPAEHLIVVLDRTGAGLEAARTEAEARLAAADGPVSLLLAGAAPSVEIARQTAPGRDALAAVLAGAGPEDGAPDWPAVASLVEAVRAPDGPARVLLVSDGPLPGPLAALAKPGLVVEGSGRDTTPGPERTLRAAVEPVDLAAGIWRVTGEIAFRGGAPDAEVVLQFAASPRVAAVDWATVEVPAPTRASDRPVARAFEREVRLPGTGLLTVRLAGGGEGEAARFLLREAPASLDVLYIGDGDQPAIQALQAVEHVTVYQADALPADRSRYGLVVVDGVEVAEHPGTNTLWIGAGRVAGTAEPPAMANPDPTVWRDDHPLARGLAWAGLDIAAATAPEAWPDGDVLLAAADGPLVEARIGPHGGEVRFAFDPAASTWPADASFPAFFHALVGWLGAEPGAVTGPACSAGSACVLDARLAGGTLAPVLPEPGPAVALGTGNTFVPVRVGVHALGKDGRETFLVVNAPAEAEAEAAAPAPEAAPAPRRIDLGRAFAALALALLVAEAVASRQLPSRRLFGRWGADGAGPRLRLAAVTAVGAALAALPMPLPGRQDAVALAAFAAGEGGSAVLRLAPDEAAAAAGHQRLTAVDLGHPPRLVPPETGAAGSGPGIVGAGGAGLMLAAATLPPGEGGRILLDGAGVPLEGDLEDAAARLRALGVAVDLLPGAGVHPDDVQVTRIEAPPLVYEGEPALATAIVDAQGASTATLTVTTDGAPAATRDIALRPGANRIEIPLGPVRGSARVEVAVAHPGDPVAGNDRNAATVLAVAPGPVAILGGTDQTAPLLAGLLEAEGIAATILAPHRVPASVDGWLDYRALVLMDLPAGALTTRQQEDLEAAVFEHGLGLVMTGGPNSFGPGGYLQTALDRVSPLSSRVPQDAPVAAIAFVLDRSGSMQARVGNATRLDIAKQATQTAIGLLDPESEVAIIAFDEEPYTLVPLQGVPSPDALAGVLGRLGPGGGTSIYPGLVQALYELRRAEASVRHVVLMSDGLSQPGDFAGVLAAMGEEGITVSGVAIGSGAFRLTVEEIAAAGGGAFHATTDVEALPSILSQETMMLSGAPVEEDPGPPGWTGSPTVFRDHLPKALPPVDGFVLTTAKPDAEVLIELPDSEARPMPLLARWRFGSGRVVAFASEALGGWTSAWQALPGYGALWSTAVREVLPADPAPLLGLGVARTGDTVAVRVEAYGAEAAPSLRLTRPGAAEAEPVPLAPLPGGGHGGRFVAGPFGDHLLEAVAGDRVTRYPLHLAYPAALDATRSEAPLRALAEATGGRVVAPGALFADAPWGWRGAPAWGWLLVALGIFLADLVLRYAPRRRAPALS